MKQMKSFLLIFDLTLKQFVLFCENLALLRSLPCIFTYLKNMQVNPEQQRQISHDYQNLLYEDWLRSLARHMLYGTYTEFGPIYSQVRTPYKSHICEVKTTNRIT